MFDATLQRRAYKTIANDDVILNPYRTLPISVSLSSVQKKTQWTIYFPEISLFHLSNRDPW